MLNIVAATKGNNYQDEKTAGGLVDEEVRKRDYNYYIAVMEKRKEG